MSNIIADLSIRLSLRNLSVVCLLAICMMSSKCKSHQTADVTSIEETLRKSDASIQIAITQKNTDTLLSFYAEDASLLPTAEPVVKGKTAIRKEWLHIFEIPDFTNKSTLTKIEVSKDGEMAYTMGEYMATMQGESGKQVNEPGKWVTIWKKQPDGRWLIVVDIYNTDIPPPDHK